MVGQLFNGNTVEIFDRRGNWYRVAMGGIDGWANRAGCAIPAAVECCNHFPQPCVWRA
jgi:hypothetical protein